MSYGTVTKDDLIKLKEAENLYNTFVAYTKSLFTHYANNGGLDINAISERLKKVWNTVRHDYRFLLRVQNETEHTGDVNYISSHSARSAIVAMIIGTYYKLPNHRLSELGISALLHDIGMFTLPPEFYLNDRILTEEEKKILYTHPVQSYKILQRLRFPANICAAVLEHHEREDGSGYPRNLIGKFISQYGKIIAVASAYDALSTKRPHKEAKDHHTGIVELLNNMNKRYDGGVIRALVYSLSFFPIGLYVLLSDGKKGQVVDVNPENPCYPVVQIFETLQPGEKRRIVQTSSNDVSISRPLDKDEVMALDKSEPPPRQDKPRSFDSSRQPASYKKYF